MGYFDQENRPTEREVYVNNKLMTALNEMDEQPRIPLNYLSVRADYVHMFSGETASAIEQLAVCVN